MTIGLLTVELFIPGSNSLKARRMVLHSIKARLRNRFNCAVSQVDGEDKWQKATLALVGVETDRSRMNSTLSEALNFLEHVGTVSLIDYEMELL